MKKWPFVALLLVGATVLGATVLREPIGYAASPFQNVIVGNDATNPVPVREQNLDGGSIKVHEQGTVNVRFGDQEVSVTRTFTSQSSSDCGGDVYTVPSGQNLIVE